MKKKLFSLLMVSVLAVSSMAIGAAADDAVELSGTSDDENTLTVAAWDANFNIPALEAAAEGRSCTPKAHTT